MGRTPEVRDGGDAREKPERGESLEDFRQEVSERDSGNESPDEEKGIPAGQVDPQGESFEAAPREVEGAEELEHFRTAVKERYEPHEDKDEAREREAPPTGEDPDHGRPDSQRLNNDKPAQDAPEDSEPGEGQAAESESVQRGPGKEEKAANVEDVGSQNADGEPPDQQPAAVVQREESAGEVDAVAPPVAGSSEREGQKEGEPEAQRSDPNESREYSRGPEMSDDPGSTGEWDNVRPDHEAGGDEKQGLGGQRQGEPAAAGQAEDGRVAGSPREAHSGPEEPHAREAGQVPPEDGGNANPGNSSHERPPETDSDAPERGIKSIPDSAERSAESSLQQAREVKQDAGPESGREKDGVSSTERDSSDAPKASDPQTAERPSEPESRPDAKEEVGTSTISISEPQEGVKEEARPTSDEPRGEGASTSAGDGRPEQPSMGEEMRGRNSESNLGNGQESPTDSPNEKAVEQSSQEGLRPSESDSRKQALETSQDLAPAKENAAAEAAGSPADKESDSRPTNQRDEDGKERQDRAGQDILERRQDSEVDSAERPEHLATFSATAVKQASDGMVRFEVRKDSFEKETGTKLESGKVYAIEGEIEGVSSFRKIHDGNSETDRLAFFAPKEKSDSIPAGERHDVRIDSVREVSGTKESLGTFFATAYRVAGREGRDDSVRLDIPKATFEKRTGFRFEDRKTYEVKGKIEGEYEFKLTHTGSRENQHVVISVFGQEAKKVDVGKEHIVTVESIEEKRVLPVTGDGPSTRVTLQKRMLESFGVDVDSMRRGDEGDRIIKVTLRNLASEEKSEKAVYAKLQPSEGTLPLSIHNVGGKRGDRVEVTSASKHTVKDFVNDFEKRKDEEIRNVRLSLEGEQLYIEVDGIRFQCKSYEQDALRLRRCLKVNVEPFQRDFRFWDDGERITAKFGDSWTIKSFTANDKGLSIHYQMGSRTINSNFLSPSDKTVLDEGIVKTDEISAGVRMRFESERSEGFHNFECSVALHNYIYTRLTQASHISESKYLEERGNLGEDLGIGILRKFSLVEVKRHPFSSNAIGRSSHEPGTDVLMRDGKGELRLYEIKWHKDPGEALERGRGELKARESKEKDYMGEKISGAYIAVLDYKMKSRQGGVRVERVW